MFALGGRGEPLPLGIIGISLLHLASGAAPATAAPACAAPASVAMTAASIAMRHPRILLSNKIGKGIKATKRALKASSQWRTRAEEEEESKEKAV